MSLDGLDRLSIDDVQEFYLYAEWEAEERARRDEADRKKAEAAAQKHPPKR